jgi:Cft2 family RNA processing exonuclease
METQQHDRPQQYTDEDVTAILDRFQGCSYGTCQIDDLTYEYGDAGHLLGSAWLALEHGGQRILFSGDLGGRSAHLREIADPPQADAAFIESTYGDTMTHRSFDDARTQLYQTVVDAVRDDRPVLIPTFAVGRAQEILQLFREREPSLPEDVTEDLEIVYDGMITDSMRVYNVFATDGWINQTLLNYKLNCDDPEPYLPDCAWTPETTEQRETLLDGTNTPVIVAPSGMLEGGWSPFYLRDLTEHYDNAQILFPGYQAAGSVGRQLIDAEGDTATVTIQALMWGEEADEPDAEGFDFHDATIEVPTDWIDVVDGLSGHAAANTILQFARTTEAPQMHLVHGSPQASQALQKHLDSNTDAGINLATNGETISITTTGAVESAAGDSTLTALEQRQQELEQEVADLRSEVATLKQRLND